MKIRIKVRNSLDYIILSVMMLDIMILRWLEVSSAVNILIMLLIVLSMSRYARWYFNEIGTWVPFSCLIIYSGLNYFLLGGGLLYYLKNMFHIVKAVLVVCYFCVLIKRNRDFAIEYVKNFFWPINFYLVLSLPFMMLQLWGYSNLVSLRTSLTGNIYIPDFMSGLFGIYGSAQQSFFFLIVMFYNHFLAKYKIHSNNNRLCLKVYNCLLFAFTLWYAQVSENKAYYISLIIFVSVAIILVEQGKRGEGCFRKTRMNPMRLFKLVGIVGILLLLVYVAYNNIEYMNSAINLIINAINIDLNETYTYVGGNERFAMIIKVLSDRGHRWMGWGIGKKMGNMVYYLNFPHFGQADIGTYMCLGGLLFVLLLIWSCYKFFQKNYSNIFVLSALTFSLIAEGVYTQVFTGDTTVLAMMFLYLLLWVIYRDNMKETKQVCSLTNREIRKYAVSCGMEEAR